MKKENPVSHAPFTMRFTDINAETGEVFSVQEIKTHGWKNKSDFVSSLSKHHGKDGVVFFENGYQYARKDIGVISKVEAV